MTALLTVLGAAVLILLPLLAVAVVCDRMAKRDVLAARRSERAALGRAAMRCREEG